MSVTTTSGTACAAWASSASASGTAATTSWPARSRIPTRPSRNSAASSARTILSPGTGTPSAPRSDHPAGLVTASSPPRASSRTAEPGQAGAVGGVRGPALPSSTTVSTSDRSLLPRVHLGLPGVGVPGDVGQRLAGHEVRRRLDRRGRPLLQADVDGDRHGGPVGDLVDRGGESVVGQHPRVDAAHRAAQVVERGLGLLGAPRARAPAPAPRRHRARHGRGSSSARPGAAGRRRAGLARSAGARSRTRRPGRPASGAGPRPQRPAAPRAGRAASGPGRPGRGDAGDQVGRGHQRRQSHGHPRTDSPIVSIRQPKTSIRPAARRGTARQQHHRRGHGEQDDHEVDQPEDQGEQHRVARSPATTPAAGGRPAAARGRTGRTGAGCRTSPSRRRSSTPTAAASTGSPASTTAPTTTTRVATPTTRPCRAGRPAWPARWGPWSAGRPTSATAMPNRGTATAPADGGPRVGRSAHASDPRAESGSAG